MWFRHRQRVDSAFAKGLMFGKAVGARDERQRLMSHMEDIANLVLLPDTDFNEGYRQAIQDIHANSWLNEVEND